VNPRIIGILALLTLAACRLGQPFGASSPLSPLDEGRDAYLRACASCHGADATGGGPVAAVLCVPPPDLTNLARTHGGHFPRERTIAVISGEHEVDAHGTREMPVWSQRFGGNSGATAAASLHARRRLELLTDYLESVQRAGRR
jgi:mono/diheme cytochrome c family protein